MGNLSKMMQRAAAGRPSGGLPADQYFTDFSEYSTGVFPSDWTARLDGFPATVETYTGATGGQALVAPMGAGVSGGPHVAEWDEVPHAADVEIVMRARTGDSGNDGFVYMLARADNLAVDRTSYRGGGRTVSLAAITYLSPSYNQLVAQSVTGSANEWLWVRFRVNGTSLKVKQWRDVDSEPSAWTAETTDSNLTEAGAAALFIWNFEEPEQVIDVFGVGLNGDAAPMTALG